MAKRNKNGNGQNYSEGESMETALKDGNWTREELNQFSGIQPNRQNNVPVNPAVPSKNFKSRSTFSNGMVLRPGLETRGRGDGQEQRETNNEEETSVQVAFNSWFLIWVVQEILKRQLQLKCHQERLEQQFRQLLQELRGDRRIEMKENKNINEHITVRSFLMETHWKQQHGRDDCSDDEEGSHESEVNGAEAVVPIISSEENRITSIRHFDDHEDAQSRLVTKDSMHFGQNGKTDNVEANHPITRIVSYSDVPKEESNGSLKKDIISERNQSPKDRQFEACVGAPEDPSDDSNSEDESKTDRAKDGRFSIDRKRYGDDKSSDNPKWRMDTNVWKKCLETENEHEAIRLVKNRILPDQDLLDRASEVFGIHSDTIHNICNAICCYVKENLHHIIHVWPALDYRNESNKKQIIFIIHTSQSSETETINYRCYKRSANEISTSCVDENKKIKELEENLPKDYSKTEKIREWLNKNSKPLMEQHTHLTRVSISWFKSIGYGTAEQSITQNICIAVYVKVKGYVPLNETVLTKVIDGFDVDVREGIVVSYAGPNEHHEQLKMGCAIHCGLKDKQGNFLGGTLGGFVEVDRQLYGISSAHIFLSAEDMEKLKDNSLSNLGNDTRIKSFEACQPVLHGARPFGVGVRAVYKEGGNGETGAEVVIIKVVDRLPISGEFPDCPHRRNPGFDSPHFSSGRICNREEVNRLIRNKTLTVVKFGCSSGWTRGSFRFDGGSARLSHMVGTIHEFGILLYNQFEIESIGDTCFAEYGDSGALVFTDVNNELSVVGIVEGGMAGVVYVTPISEVFTALDLQGIQNMKIFPPQCRNIQNKPLRISDTHSSRHLTNRGDSGDLSTDGTTLRTVEEKLETLEQELPQEIAKQAYAIKVNMNTSINQELGPVKSELNTLKSDVSVLTSKVDAMQREMKGQTELLKNLLAQFSPPNPGTSTSDNDPS